MAMAGERTVPAAEEAADLRNTDAADLETRLQELRNWVKGHPHPMNHIFWLSLEEFDAYVDEIIEKLPGDVRRARRISRDEQRIVQDAKDEARRVLEEARAEAQQIVTAAREEADRLVEGSTIRQRAVEQAEATVAQAQETASEIRESSYTYAEQVIENVITSLRRLSDSIEQDREQLRQMQPRE